MEPSNKTIVRILAITTLFILLLFFLYQIRSIIFFVIAAFLLTLILNPVVSWFQKYMPKKNRAAAIFCTLFLFVSFLLLVGSIVISPLVKETSELVGQINPLINQFKQNEGIKDLLAQNQSQYIEKFQTNVLPYAKQALSTIGGSVGGFLGSITSGIFASVTILVLTLFMLLDTPRVVKSLEYYIPKKYHKLYEKLQEALSGIITKYVAGVLFIAATAGFGTFLILSIMRVPYSLALAVAVAAFDLVPMVGATLGAVIVVLVAFFSSNPIVGIVMIVYYVLYQLFENYILVPAVQKKTVKISPIGILLALLIGSTLGGMIGTLIAIPAAAFVKVVYETLKDQGYIGQHS